MAVIRMSDKNREIKIQVLLHYGADKMKLPACIKCGFSDLRALTLDHINGKEKSERNQHKGGGLPLYRKLKQENYPEGYQTLCMNCQWVKRHEVDMPRYFEERKLNAHRKKSISYSNFLKGRQVQ